MKKIFYYIFALLVIVLGLLTKIETGGNVVVSREQDSLNSVVATTTVKITFLDVGQGDASLIEFPDKEKMLVDCAIDNRILEALGRTMSFYDRQIDYLLITHPDNDHYGGCIEVLKRFEVKNIVYSGLKKENDSQWREFWQTIQDEGAKYWEIDKEQTWDIASTTVHFIYPDHSISVDSNIPGIKKTNDNDTSIVFKLTTGDKSALFMGVAETELEKYLVNKHGVQLYSDIVKVGHHGSGGASSEEFLAAVSPVDSIISCGKNNRYGHPSLRVLKKLERAGSKVWRTDEKGDILL
jgi:competence protein ComEC